MAQQPPPNPAGIPQQPSSNSQSAPVIRPVQSQAGPNPLLSTGLGQLPLQILLAAMQQQPQQPIHSNILAQIRALAPQVQPRPSAPMQQLAAPPPMYLPSQGRPPQPYQPAMPYRPVRPAMQATVSRPPMQPPRASLPLAQPSAQQAMYARQQPRPYQSSGGVTVPVQPARPALPPQPPSEEDLRLLPLQSIRRMARAAFGPESGLSEEVETALMQLADDWITSALTLGCGAAGGRKSTTLMPEDVAKPLEAIWNVRVPGAGSDTVTSHKRSAAPELHQTRAKAVRRAVAQASVAQAPAAQPSAAPAVVAQPVSPPMAAP